MRAWLVRLRLGVWFVALAAASARAELPPCVLQALGQAGIPPQAVAVVVQPLASPAPGLVHRGGEPMNPASLMKLLTTAAALELLGPGYTFRTEVLATDTPRAGVLEGPLYLRGSGDPKFTVERLWLLLRELRARGLREIRGDLIFDRSVFAVSEHDPAAFDGQPLRPYNVGPDGLLFNFATLTLTLIPTAGAAQLFVEPRPAAFEVVNRLEVTPTAACPSDWRQHLDIQLTPQRLTLAGRYPLTCGEKRLHLAGLPNAILLHGVFTQLWRELGGQFAGGWQFGTPPSHAQPLAVSESPPLAELVRDINKFSNNVMARQLFLKVGAGETARAEQAIRAWLANKGLAFPELVLDNGSGLSRRERLAARSLARLLATLWQSPIMPELVASLPIVAVDGTAKQRYRGVPYAGQAHLKTGSLEGVRGIAGYLLDRSGQRHVVVFIVNHPNAEQAQAAFDALLTWLWQGAC